MKKWGMFALVIMLGGCGGSDGGSGGGSSTSAPPPPATLSVTLKDASLTQSVSEGATKASFSFTASYTGTPDGSVVPDVSFDKNVLALDGDMAVTGQSVTVKLASLAGLSTQNRSGDVTFRLCRDTSCSIVYPGSTQTFRYTLNVALRDWVTFQRTPSHTGYVKLTLDPQKVTKAWEWSKTGTTGYMPVAIAGNRLLVTRLTSTSVEGAFSAAKVVHAIDTASGSDQWSYDLGGVYNASGPAIAGDRIMITTMNTSSGNNRIVTLNLSSGQFIRNMLFGAQWSTFAQPTPVDDDLYVAAGYYGNVVTAYNLNDGTQRWMASGKSGKVWDGETVAADDQYVYYYSGSLDVFRRSDGSLVQSIADPFWNWNGYSYSGGPIIGSRKNVIAYSGSGMGTYAISFPLVSFDLASGAYAWRTADTYSTTPALANGTLYAASNNKGQLDAISEETGKVIWSWPAPNNETFIGNMIVTDNVILLSTTAKVYMVSLSDRTTLWSAPTPGMLAISPDGKLIVTPQGAGVDQRSGPIIAYGLR